MIEELIAGAGLTLALIFLLYYLYTRMHTERRAREVASKEKQYGDGHTKVFWKELIGQELAEAVRDHYTMTQLGGDDPSAKVTTKRIITIVALKGKPKEFTWEQLEGKVYATARVELSRWKRKRRAK